MVERGFSLIELVVTLAILAILLLMAVPFTTSWVQSARVNDAKSKLLQSYELARALAQRNPNDTRAPAVAAGIKVDGETLLVCLGNPASTATCVKDASAVKWWSALPAGTTVVVGTAGNTTLGLDNTGLPLSASNFTVTNGNVNETGSLH